MCGLGTQSTNLPEVSGAQDERFVYHLTEAGRRAVAERRARRERQRARARKAREEGHRVGTVCGRWRDHGRVPDLRMTGHWLRKAGFDLGQPYRVTVEAGKLTIQAL